MCYTICVVAHHLIVSKDGEEPDKKDEEKKETKPDFDKLTML